MDRRQGTIMAGIHCLEHVQRFRSTNLADNYAIRTHTQTVTHEVALSHLTIALDIRRPCLESHNVWLSQLQLS